MKKLLITGCSKKKSETPGMAKKVYKGNLFRKCLELATKWNYDLLILSAKYGLLNPNDMIHPYEKVIKSKKEATFHPFSLQIFSIFFFKLTSHLPPPSYDLRNISSFLP